MIFPSISLKNLNFAFKISNSAIRTVDGEKGVYIVRGNLMGFRKIHVLYSTDTFSIVDNPKDSSEYIKLYDNVVTEGVDLYDNKLVWFLSFY